MHALPQRPQLVRLVCGSTQVLLQTASGAVHTSRQLPEKQIAFGAQARPQAPQFARSLLSAISQPFVALLSQFAKPAPQAPRAQVPVAQVAEALAKAQTRPQAPQLRTSVCVSTSQPFAALPSQLPKPALHATPQAPDAQVAEAFARGGHTVPQAPQFAALVLVLTSHPLAGSPSQFAEPAAQTTPQTPAWHRAVAPPPAVHALPQRMQLDTSLVRFTSQPLAGFVSQSAKPVLQVATAQAPAAQLDTPFVAWHRRPQAPQFAVSPCGFTQRPPQHDSPVPQRVPQAPQLFASSWVFAQELPQQVCPAPQGRVIEQPATQEFIRQIWPGAQSSSPRQFTQARVIVSQREPPLQSMSLRHPGTQAFMLQ
jgi:hypothetical protein